jgi:DNA-directed RNA polymerase subunit RPC12/RpoP
MTAGSGAADEATSEVQGEAPEEIAAETFEIVCPHCKKTFTAKLMRGAAERYRGFKCPHCKLFVPAERVTSDRAASG